MSNPQTLNNNLSDVKKRIYDPLSLYISDLKNETEGTEYDACQFELNKRKIICRSAKITPKKVGQFVTFWKRDAARITTPFSETDSFEFYVINVKTEDRFGQFVFPKSVLIEKGIVSTESKDGKRGFRVYPNWDEAQNKQAVKTQKWQLDYFYEIDASTDLERVKAFYVPA